MKKDIISGVYAIRNNNNNMYYIGSSFDIHNRFVKHKSRLNKGENGSKNFQEDWAKSKDKVEFELIIIEEVEHFLSKEELKNKEQVYINYYSKLGICYNHAHNAFGGNGKGELHPFYGKPVCIKTKIKISEALSGRKLSEEHRKNIGKSQIGHKRLTEDSIRRIKEKQRKLSDAQVLEILDRIKNREKLIDIKKDYEVSYSTIKGIKNGTAYSHVPR